MFYARINKIKVFNNREGFLGLFNHAELRIYSLASNPTGVAKLPDSNNRGFIQDKSGRGFMFPPVIKIEDLLRLDEDERKEKLLDAVLLEVALLAQCNSIEINRVKDNQTLLFGDSGMMTYQNKYIPEELNIQLWVIESDSDIRKFATDADTVLESDAFKGLLGAVEVAIAVTNPILGSVITVGGVVTQLLRKKLRANKDDLVGYWQASLNREEHYPHGVRDRQNVPDTTGNILIDYTLFGFENAV
jgi:hypothetical protein